MKLFTKGWLGRFKARYTWWFERSFGRVRHHSDLDKLLIAIQVDIDGFRRVPQLRS